MSTAKESAFWNFSKGLYGRPGVARACLALQDRCGLDVNILLFCCWAGGRGQALTVEELGKCIAAVQPWQERVVKPLRAARRWLKGQHTAPAGAAEDLRQAIMAQELEAERLEQLVLTEVAALVDDKGTPALTAANLCAYVSVLELVPGAEDRRDLAALICGLFDGLREEEALMLLTGACRA